MTNVNKEWSDMTTMRISDKLRDKLKTFKIRKGETLESVITRILATVEENDLDIITEELLHE